jgi:tRNA G18 (ribose-2'-O)-methylase SpoU
MIGILDNIRSAFNVGGIFRTADGAGVEHLFLCGITPTPSQQPSLAKTALGAEKTVSWSAHPNALTVVEKMRNEGFGLLALERTAGSVPIQDFSLRAMQGRPLGLIVGHERAGIDPGLLEYCDGLIALPMVGRKASLNAAVAFGVAAYWLAFTQTPGV